MITKNQLRSVFLLLLFSSLVNAQVDSQPIRNWRQDNEQNILNTYFSLLGVPNISRGNGDTSANVPVLRSLLTEQGFTVTTSADRYLHGIVLCVGRHHADLETYWGCAVSGDFATPAVGP